MNPPHRAVREARAILIHPAEPAALLERGIVPLQVAGTQLFQRDLTQGGDQVLVDGVRCELTYKEYELLKLLLKNKGIVLSRDQIMDLIWDGHLGLESRTVDVHIKSLRQKLGTRGEEIKTVRNVGYRVG